MPNAVNNPLTLECISDLDQWALETYLINEWVACREYRMQGMDIEADACHAACHVIIERANQILTDRPNVITPQWRERREHIARTNIIAQCEWSKKSNNWVDAEGYAEIEAMIAFESGVHPQVPHLARALLY